ncbi:hypothetical protein NC653_039791 [Populus alba x Populus x berolinensis]|uniref:Uncharacterized protein n=1 Tax=Populus alba x Populus x berolinensis TaxID=444605 RepID=A0AAD6LC28_9ROSI|nr:hypothetical protein NC653_039791 [Populus alba x Populus x berolinensis]
MDSGPGQLLGSLSPFECGKYRNYPTTKWERTCGSGPQGKTRAGMMPFVMLNSILYNFSRYVTSSCLQEAACGNRDIPSWGLNLWSSIQNELSLDYNACGIMNVEYYSACHFSDKATTMLVCGSKLPRTKVETRLYFIQWRYMVNEQSFNSMVVETTGIGIAS